MTTDFNGLWAEVRTAENEVGAVQALAQILSSKEGRAFTESLELTDGVLCIEIIDHVRPGPPFTILLADANSGSRQEKPFPI